MYEYSEKPQVSISQCLQRLHKLLLKKYSLDDLDNKIIPMDQFLLQELSFEQVNQIITCLLQNVHKNKQAQFFAQLFQISSSIDEILASILIQTYYYVNQLSRTDYIEVVNILDAFNNLFNENSKYVGAVSVRFLPEKVSKQDYLLFLLYYRIMTGESDVDQLFDQLDVESLGVVNENQVVGLVKQLLGIENNDEVLEIIMEYLANPKSDWITKEEWTAKFTLLQVKYEKQKKEFKIEKQKLYEIMIEEYNLKQNREITNLKGLFEYCMHSDSVEELHVLLQKIDPDITYEQALVLNEEIRIRSRNDSLTSNGFVQTILINNLGNYGSTAYYVPIVWGIQHQLDTHAEGCQLNVETIETKTRTLAMIQNQMATGIDQEMQHQLMMQKFDFRTVFDPTHMCCHRCRMDFANFLKYQIDTLELFLKSAKASNYSNAIQYQERLKSSRQMEMLTPGDNSFTQSQAIMSPGIKEGKYGLKRNSNQQVVSSETRTSKQIKGTRM